ncbi:MAG TPA: TolC family protein [Pirellulales bacterium]|nr:TolC family protein [Pirellulales bacterium]
MLSRRLITLAGLLLATGCTWPVRQATNQTVCRMANQPYDLRPDESAALVKPSAAAGASDGTSASGRTPEKATPARPAHSASRDGLDARSGGTAPQVRPASSQNELRYAAAPQDISPAEGSLDARTDAWLNSPKIGPLRDAGGGPREARARVAQTAAWMPPPNDSIAAGDRRLQVNIPPRLPGAEVPRIELAPDDTMRMEEIGSIYPELPPMPIEPQPLPGPEDRPYTLTELQRIAAANSPLLRQAVADVQRAYGAWIQACTYANPQGSFFVDPNANNTSAGVQGLGIEQVIKTGGKQKLAAASARVSLDNAELALRRARNDLATQVRQAYFAILVDKETLAVTRAVAHFTDDMYQLQTALLRGATAAPYEPASLRAQAMTTRLAYQQAIATYIFDWKSLVAALGLRQLPLTQVGGQIDRFIPYYDYDAVLAYVLRNHTDILSARNLVPQARYNLRLAQLGPLPDLDVAYRYGKDFTANPFGSYSQFLLQMPLPVWDRNRGNIMSAQAALIRASEEEHRAAIALTDNLANAYTNYKNSLYAIDYYRRYILPDLVQYYRGIQARRQVDPNAAFPDLVFAQQNLSQNVTAYLVVLGNMWQSVVGVAALLQTDDLFQMATPRPLPELPDFDELSRWACSHSTIAASCGVNVAPTRPSGGSPPSTSDARPRGAGPALDSPSRNAGPTSPPSRSAGATLASRRPRRDEQEDR